jgi:hypothetical protein
LCHDREGNGVNIRELEGRALLDNPNGGLMVIMALVHNIDH